jgi:hypothetical protein
MQDVLFYGACAIWGFFLLALIHAVFAGVDDNRRGRG